MAVQFDPNALSRFADVNLRKSDAIANLDGKDGLKQNGTETLPDGSTRPHTLNVYDVGMGGDGLRGCNRTGSPNPYEVYRAHVDAPEVYDSNGTLLSGGKHYGHLEVNVCTNETGLWTATLTPAYVFVSTNAATGKLLFDRRIYPDEVVITNSVSRKKTGMSIKVCRKVIR
ncbi:MAG: hypothetical protein IJG13_20455 [Kiritimatiellae bacterium]|nr:hypothetical protein [Kiritimatiellia bacterium]MBQ3340523.1 hypothetical protein [Kiritimatiellia bacterium]